MAAKHIFGEPFRYLKLGSLTLACDRVHEYNSDVKKREGDVYCLLKSWDSWREFVFHICYLGETRLIGTRSERLELKMRNDDHFRAILRFKEPLVGSKTS